MKQIKGRPLPLGTTDDNNQVNFSVAVPVKEMCELLLYKRGQAKPFKKYPMPAAQAVGEVRFLAFSGSDIYDYEYNYLIGGQIHVDPYARAICGREEWGAPEAADAHQVRARIIREDYDWEGDRHPAIPYHDVIAYSLHVRGFTMDKGAKVKHPGTFQGVIEKLDYMKELGINQIHCMPVYEFMEGSKRLNYWGYGPAYCYAPKASYAASKDGTKELKDMVKACHREDIEVILDLPFSADTPQQMMEDCLRYYYLNYHVDGFILNPVLAPVSAVKADPILATAKIMEKQDGFQNVMRRFLKSDEGMIGDVIYWLKRHSADDGIFNYITTHTGFTLCDLVSYDGKHNELNGENNQDGPEYNYSWNCGAEGPSRKKSVISLRKKQMRNAFLLLLTAQGTPCILAGDEFANSQNGNNNVYCQDNEIGWVNWNKLKKEQALFSYVKKLIAFRKAHRLMHPPEELLGMDKTSCGVPDISYHGESAWQAPTEIASRKLGVYYSGANLKEEDGFIAYNMHWLKHNFALPALPKGKKWYQVMSTSDEGLCEEVRLSTQKSVEVDERTITIFVGR